MKDPRQSAMNNASKGVNFAEDEKGNKIVFNNKDKRFFASAVNLGELFNTIVREHNGKPISVDSIFEIVDRDVERLKTWEIKKTKKHWYIDFTTKDDHSYYHYAFSIYEEELK